MVYIESYVFCAIIYMYINVTYRNVYIKYDADDIKEKQRLHKLSVKI